MRASEGAPDMAGEFLKLPLAGPIRPTRPIRPANKQTHKGQERRAYGSRVCGYKCLRFTISVVSECSCSSSSANYEFVFRCRALHPGRECAVLSEDQTRDKENSQVVQSLDGSGRQ